MSPTQAPVAAPDTLSFGRIRFVTSLTPGARVLREFTQPCHAAATYEPLSLDALTAGGDAESAGAPDCLLTCFAASANPELRRRAEQWIAGSPGPAVALVEVSSRSGRILWRPGRAVVEGFAQQADVLLALAAFAFYEAELRSLEHETDVDWPTARTDSALTHGVSRADLRRWPQVNAMTRRVTLSRMRQAELERCIAEPGADLPAGARRLLRQLSDEADLSDRLDRLDQRSELVYDIYELANDRISEFSYFVREFRLELWIIVLLVAEVVIMLVELWLTWRNGE